MVSNTEKLPFVCPICGGKLVLGIFKSGTDDYYISKTGKRYKKPFRSASRQLDAGDGVMYINCEHAPRYCNFITNGELGLEYYDEYKIVVADDDSFELYKI